MKHSVKITSILLLMFFLTQLIGIGVANFYSPKQAALITENNTQINFTNYNLPYGMEPPKEINPQNTVVTIIVSLIFAVSLMFILMKVKAESFLRLWFFVVIVIALGITLNSPFRESPYYSFIVLLIAIPLAFIKVFRRNIYIHNLTEMLIYPGIAVIIAPLLNLWAAILLFVLISVYDMYAVWHSGFMQKMAKYQIQTLKVFSGFFIPYIGKKEKQIISKMKKLKSKKEIRLNVAILGGGDVVFPIILSAVVLWMFGFWAAFAISIGATLALAVLFVLSERGKFYPAMPFITMGCFTALAIVYLSRFI